MATPTPAHATSNRTNSLFFQPRLGMVSETGPLTFALTTVLTAVFVEEMCIFALPTFSHSSRILSPPDGKGDILRDVLGAAAAGWWLFSAVLTAVSSDAVYYV